METPKNERERADLGPDDGSVGFAPDREGFGGTEPPRPDAAIHRDIIERMSRHPRLDSGGCKIVVRKGEVRLAGVVASRILYRGESLLSFRLEMGGLVVFFVLAILGPLLMFTPKMAEAKRKGLADYGQVAQGYVNSFEEKWVLNTPPSEEVLGSGDIQSLADLNNSFEIVSNMRAVPFWLEDIIRLAAATAAPMVPLLLTIFPLEELITRLVKIVF